MFAVKGTALQIKKLFFFLYSKLFIDSRSPLHARLFWTIIISISCWQMAVIFILIIKRYFEDSLSISVDTSYLRWNHYFPAITLCLIKNKSNLKVKEFIEKNNIQYETRQNNYVKNIYDYIFANPTNLNLKADYCKGTNSTCGIDINYVKKELLTQSCSDFMSDVIFLGNINISCDKIFKFHDLEVGYCFTANNLMTKDADFDLLPLQFNTFHLKRSLRFYLKIETFWKYEMFIHSAEDLPYFGLESHTISADNRIYNFNIEEIRNGPDVITENFRKRKCKYPHETIFGSSYNYGFSTCMTDLRIILELKYCNCTLFTSPKRYSKFYCSISGMLCISKAGIIAKTKDLIRRKLICYPTCTEQKLFFVGFSEIENINRPGFVRIEINIKNIPTIRFQREIVQTPLDVMVSAGGVMGLFIGASILNIVELCYFGLKQIL